MNPAAKSSLTLTRRRLSFWRRHPGVVIASAAWIALNTAVVFLARGFLPFDRPALMRMPLAQQVALPTLGLVELLILGTIVYFLTRRRAPIDWAGRVGSRSATTVETYALILYALAAQGAGWLVGPALGYRPFSFHIAGTLVGCTTPLQQGEVFTWAAYNFVMFAVLPWAWFRRRYSAEQLGLRFMNRWNDIVVIAVVAALESIVEIASFPGLGDLTTRQLLIGMPISFSVFFVGTVLPTMILIYAILLPRYLALTGSWSTTIVLGGVSYAAMHLVEGWSNFSSPTDTALSIIFVFVTYFGPGMFKAFVTLRTGNAWVHAIGYHAIAPHVVVDTPLMVKTFGI